MRGNISIGFADFVFADKNFTEFTHLFSPKNLSWKMTKQAWTIFWVETNIKIDEALNHATITMFL